MSTLKPPANSKPASSAKQKALALALRRNLTRRKQAKKVEESTPQAGKP